MNAINETDILKKACSYCIYQERTQAGVRQKLKTWGVSRERSEEIIVWLITENFINESRYARQFAGGKFRVKKWGKRKIIYELKAKGITPNCIKEALSEINDEEYFHTLRELARRKTESLAAETDPFVIRKKVTAWLLMKGYEAEYLKDVLEQDL